MRRLKGQVAILFDLYLTRSLSANLKTINSLYKRYHCTFKKIRFEIILTVVVACQQLNNLYPISRTYTCIEFILYSNCITLVYIM